LKILTLIKDASNASGLELTQRLPNPRGPRYRRCCAMMHPTLVGIGLVRLGDSGFVPANPEAYLRGKDVFDPHGQRMGCVEDLYVDRQEREVRYLEVGTGGFLGIGERRFLVPVEAVTKVSEDRVIVEPDTKKEAEGPAPFDTKVGPPSATERRDGYASPPFFGNAEGTADPRGDIYARFPFGR
jgi:sporulation protein YlmC with PRC-barrel domain